ncbi:ArgS-related anticodon-binding protein NrtL [Streptomyces sp. 8N706]|uniref:ArgS-related anticodon-binding protein NrtL n=1 Tax=Streptomyces sp. 8N706 TaxID=3457416 RepID=UPI003FD6A3A6
MTPADLSRTVLRTVRCAVEAGELHAPVPTRAVVQRPPRPGCGDYATNIALQLAGPAGHPPRRIAEILRPRLAQAPGVDRVEIAGPGFLNITLDDDSHSGLVRTVLSRGRSYGSGDTLAGQVVELTFPRETRAAVTADALARILRTQGAARVTIRCQGEPDPDWAELAPGTGSRAYTAQSESTSESTAQGANTAQRANTAQGVYTAQSRTVRPVADLRPVPVRVPAAELLRRLGPDAARWALLRPAAHDHPRTDPDELLAQRESNPLFRVQYAHARACALLRNAADLGVLAPASADRGVSADAGRAAAPSHPADTGPAAAPRQPVDTGTPAAPAPPVDTGRQAEPRHAPDPGQPGHPTPAPANLLAVVREHAAPGDSLAAVREHATPGDSLAAVREHATPGDSFAVVRAHAAPADSLAAVCEHPAAADLLAAVREYPAVLASAARLKAPDRVARHLEVTADAFFRFHDTCSVLPRGDEKPEAAHRARVALAEAAGTVLAGGLHLLGITAPVHL